MLGRYGVWSSDGKLSPRRKQGDEDRSYEVLLAKTGRRMTHLLHRVVINAIVVLTSPWHDDYVVWAFIPPTLESSRGTMSTGDYWNTRLHNNADESSDHSSIDLDILTVPVLKERLRTLGLAVGGRKAELIERLRTSEQMPEVEFRSNVDVSINDITLDSHDNDVKEHITTDIQEEGMGESASTRRAKRKRFWKTNEIRELIKAADPSAPAKAEEMIITLERMAKQENNTAYLPGPVEYTLLIDAYGKSGTVDAIKRAEAVIERLLGNAVDGSSSSSNEAASTVISISPTAQMLNAIMSTYAAIGNVESAEKATTILERMEYLKRFGHSIKPTVHSYSIAISAWAKCGIPEAAEMAEGILNRFMKEYDEVLLLLLLQNEKLFQYEEEIRPNNVVVNSVMDAWACSGSAEAGEKAQALLHRMEGLSRVEKYNIQPDTISYNTCIKAWCNSNLPNSPIMAEQVLSKLETNPQYPNRGSDGNLIVRPNRLSYNTVINAWARSQLPESAQRAEALLLRMIRYSKSVPLATPDVATFSTVLNAIAKSKTVKKKAEKCSTLLQIMIDLHEKDGSQFTKPNVICYNTVLNACAFSASPGTSESELRQALAVAVKTFNLMRQGDESNIVDAVSYGNMLKACANLLPPGDQRSAIASRLFTSCCADGLVGGMCLDEIRRCMPPPLFLSLLADCGYDTPQRQQRKVYSVTLVELPQNWTRNVVSTDMASRQRGSFVKPKLKPISIREEKKAPYIIRPSLIVEYGASGRDL